MKILIAGKGGREHALARALHDSPGDHEIHAFPGSDGMGGIVQRVELEDPAGLVDWMVAQGIELCVVGEESYLVEGLSDQCEQAGIRAWGPARESAELEASKRFAKEFMLRHHVPTGGHTLAATADEIHDAVTGYPTVLKFDGLAAGKGVSVCFDEASVEEYINSVMVKKIFGAGRVLVEEHLTGKELSVICAVAGNDYQVFTPARDYKRLKDNDQGPNTGGMGAVASMELVEPELMERVKAEIIEPTVNGLQADGLSYRGFLYFGLMLTPDGPKVIEYNCRFGDPEAQAVLPMIEGDVAQYLYEGAAGTLHKDLISFREGWNVCVVLASREYPVKTVSGDVISGLEELDGARIYHAGTVKNSKGEFETHGGRVLAAVSHGATREEAVSTAYVAADRISFAGAQRRNDIGVMHF